MADKAKMKGKTRKVLEHLEQYGTITSLEAIEHYGATRLSSIIFVLKNTYGYEINTIMCEFTDRFGNEGRYAKYMLVK